MLNKACRMNRRRLGLLRLAAIIVGFLCVIHIAHRECAKNSDLPVKTRAAIPDLSDTKARPQRSKSTETFHATAYCLTGLTTAGVPTAPGYVSADPNVIPLGSMIYIESPLMGMNGIYQVMDTGELIKGKIIDIFIPSYEACLEFGRRAVKVKILRYGFKGERPEKEQKNAASK